MSNRKDIIAFRVTEPESERAEKLAAQKIKSKPYLSKAAVYRELFGFTETGLITSTDRAYLRGDIPTLPALPEGPSGSNPQVEILDRADTLEEAERKKGTLQQAAI